MIIICVVAFYGENFLPEYKDDYDNVADFHPSWKYNTESKNYDVNDESTWTVCSGRYRTYDGLTTDYDY